MTKYLVIGSGRWATHLQRLLTLSGLPFQNWNRREHSYENLTEKANAATHVWLCVSDQAIPEFLERFSGLPALLLHSSGALEFPGAHSVHPLMSFRPEIYDDDFYPRLAFTTVSDLSPEQLIPGLRQSLTRIPADKKTFYHAMCVLAGNGSVLLWQKFFGEMTQLGVPEAAARLYCERILSNMMSDPASALTGPLVRNDRMTLLKDLQALETDPYQSVLQALIQSYHQASHNKGGRP